MRSPLTLLTREVRPLSMTVDNTLLLLQDVHAPFADPVDGYLASRCHEKVLSREFDEYFEILKLITPNFPTLLTVARGIGIGVAFSCLGFHEDETPSAFQTATGWTWNLDQSEGAIPEAWRPLSDAEVVFSKPGWGALANPSFAECIATRSIENILIAGTLYEYGIRQTCYELSDLGIGVLVISDAVVALTFANQNQTSSTVGHGLIKLRSTVETLDLLEILQRDGTVVV